MKRIIILLGCFLFLMSVSAREVSKYSNVNSKNDVLTDGVEEVINTDSKGFVRADYTIPEGFDFREITIVSFVFDGLSFDDLTSGVRVKLGIVNNSLNRYDYVSKSLILSAADFSDYNVSKIDNTSGFDGQKIPVFLSPFRCANSAIKSLYGTDNINESMLSDEALDPKLFERDYSGIYDLNNYFLDFYNQKYGVSARNLEDFDDDIIKEMFSGECFGKRETNVEIAELGYNWWYNKLIYFVFDDVYHLNDDMNDIFSKVGTEYLDFSVGVDSNYITPAFSGYDLKVYLSFKLSGER